MTHPLPHNTNTTLENTNDDLPPPYSPIPQQLPNVAPGQHVSVEQAYPASIGESSIPAPYYPQSQNNIRFTMPQPYPISPQQQQQQQYIPPQAMYHPHSSTPLYHHYNNNNSQYDSQQPGLQYGSISKPIPPAGFHTIHIPTPPQPQYYHSQQQDEEDEEEGVSCQRRFPFGALFFVFGWMLPPLWVLGACCCASSRHPSERWWAGLNLTMALLLLFSSVFYSSLASV